MSSSKVLAAFLCVALVGCFLEQAVACGKFYALMARAGVRTEFIDRLRALESLRPLFNPFRGLRPFRPVSEGLRLQPFLGLRQLFGA